jgi:hypothetical protein
MKESLFDTLQNKMERLDIPMKDMIAYFRGKCSYCGHQRIMHDEFGKCDGVMNKPCSSGCDNFKPE